MLVSDELKIIINNTHFAHSQFDSNNKHRVVSLVMIKMVFSLERALQGQRI